MVILPPIVALSWWSSTICRRSSPSRQQKHLYSSCTSFSSSSSCLRYRTLYYCYNYFCLLSSLPRPVCAIRQRRASLSQSPFTTTTFTTRFWSRLPSLLSTPLLSIHSTGTSPSGGSGCCSFLPPNCRRRNVPNSKFYNPLPTRRFINKMTTSRTSTSMPSSDQPKQVVVDPFCYRQFLSEQPPGATVSSSSYQGTIFTDLNVVQMEDIVNRHYDPAILRDGYAPFCKHLFIPNDGYSTSAFVNILPITPDNEHLLRTTYQTRNDRELPVLVRYFPKDAVSQPLPLATFFDIILYSREQIQKENDAMAAAGDNGSSSKDESPPPPEAPWGIVSIKAQNVDFELPMTPITAMRNALGKEEGGSGVPLDRPEYLKAVEYWSKHAIVS